MELTRMISGQTASWPAVSSISPLDLQKRSCKQACCLFASDLFWCLLPFFASICWFLISFASQEVICFEKMDMSLELLVDFRVACGLQSYLRYSLSCTCGALLDEFLLLDLCQSYLRYSLSCTCVALLDEFLLLDLCQSYLGYSLSCTCGALLDEFLFLDL